MKEELGDFEEIKEPISNKEKERIFEKNEDPTARVRFPRKGEFIGRVMQRLGGNRMEVKSTDGKIRNCRVPGRFKRKFWLRPRDLVIIMPWPDDDNKGDIIFQYQKNSEHQLKKRGLLSNLQNEF